MRPGQRLARIAAALIARGRAGQFHVVEAVPIGTARAEGRGLGLYRDGPDGSLVGRLVYDPAAGEPVVPEGKLAPWGLLVVLGPEHIDPPPDGP